MTKKNNIVMAVMFLLAMMIASISVSAYRVDFNYTVTAEVMDICPVDNTTGDFRMRFYSNGVDRYASMTENERQYWNLSTYVDLDLEKMCEDSTLGEQLEEYKNITSYLVENVNQCSNVYSVMNDTHYFATQYGNVSGAYGRVLSSYEYCKNNSAELKTEHDTMEKDLKDKTSSLQSCVISRDKFNTDLSSCKDDLKDAEKSGDNVFFWGIAGVGLGWFLWGRKKKESTSEEEELYG